MKLLRAQRTDIGERFGCFFVNGQDCVESTRYLASANAADRVEGRIQPTARAAACRRCGLGSRCRLYFPDWTPIFPPESPTLPSFIPDL